MTFQRLRRAILWLMAFAALAISTLMAWIGISTFGPFDTQTLVTRFVLIGAFLGSAILMEHSIRAQTWERRKFLLGALSLIGVLELATLIWTSR